jgi:hypothetical protein
LSPDGLEKKLFNSGFGITTMNSPTSGKDGMEIPPKENFFEELQKGM